MDAKSDRKYHLLIRNRFENGGSLSIMKEIDRSASDYKDLLAIGRQFAEMGYQVQVLCNIHYKNPDYIKFFGLLANTKYYRKCPDLRINDRMYEYESFIETWNKRKLSRMISHGARQSPYIIIKNTGGCSDRFIIKSIFDRLKDKSFNHDIKEVWIYEKGGIRLIYKKR